jgi:hypothetical protein
VEDHESRFLPDELPTVAAPVDNAGERIGQLQAASADR